MKKQITLLLTGATLALGGVLLVDGLSAAQEPASPEMTPEEIQAIMMEQMKMGQPGPEHEKLQAHAGSWTTEIKMRMGGPDSPWETYQGNSKIQKALGGRYTIEKFTAELGFMGKMEGLLILGYNNMTGEFESIWMDNMSTWTQTAAGAVDEGGVLELKGMMHDIISPEGRPYRHVTHPVDADHFVTKMYDTIPPAGDVLVMEIAYTRVKE